MSKVLIVDDQYSWRKFNSDSVYKLLGNDTEVLTASSAQEGYTKLLENKDKPFDILLTDMQMETDYLPKYAGEWLIEQAQNLHFCNNTKIIIISATMQIKSIAKLYNVNYIAKSAAATSIESIKTILKN